MDCEHKSFARFTGCRSIFKNGRLKGGLKVCIRFMAQSDRLRIAATIGGTALRRKSLEVLRQQSTSKPEVPMFRARFWKLQSPFCRNSFGLGIAIAKRINEAWLASGRSCRFHDQGI